MSVRSWPCTRRAFEVLALLQPASCLKIDTTWPELTFYIPKDDRTAPLVIGACTETAKEVQKVTENTGLDALISENMRRLLNNDASIAT